MGWIYNGTPELDAVSSWRNLVVTNACMCTLSVIVVGLRFWVRRKTIYIEDWITLLGEVCAIAYGAASIEQTRYGLGLPVALRPKQDLAMYTLYNYAGRPMYLTGIGCFKLSLCFSYLRFTNRTTTTGFRNLIYIIIGLVATTTVSFICLNLFGCRPVRRALDRSIDGYCLSFGPVNYYISITVILADFVIFLLPVRMIQFLSLPLRQKVGICVMFGLGLFTTVFSILRATAINAVGIGTGDTTNLVWFACFEINVGIILSCLPYLRKVVSKKRDTKSGSRTSLPNNSRNLNVLTVKRGRQSKVFAEVKVHSLGTGRERGASQDSILMSSPVLENGIVRTTRYEVRHDHSSL